MNSVIHLSYHQDPQAFRVGELDPHAYFIPFEREEACLGAREESRFFTLLNGSWRFRYRPSLYQMEDFFAPDYDLSAFEEITVPEVWQCHGADGAQYLTSPYPFVFDPPFVPEKNPCAAYVKEFAYSPVVGKRYELHIEGKDSCAYVWLNGHFVGYGECPHCDSAFDVTPFLQKGKNRLCILVLKWCSGSYLDDQDKIRLSGLFRDVYLLERSEGGLRDLRISTQNDGRVSLWADAQKEVRFKLQKDGAVLSQGILKKGGTTVTVAHPDLWSAENPVLYDLLLFCDGEWIAQRFGFREVCVENGVFMVNGKPVKLYGVNRHDSSPDSGYALDLQFLQNELHLMKQHNINAIRTSHYPNDPRFYQLCDELGFYVMSEADMECHGCSYVEDWGAVVEKPTFANAIHDRMVRMYETFRNQTCICIWSLGNESSWGENLKNEARYFKATDPSRPLHYEGWASYARRNPEAMEFIREYFDFYSRMYPTFDSMRQSIESEDPRFSYVMCEYSHAMGNSCGDLRFYDEIIQSSDRYAGGFIWEWCDHALCLTDQNQNAYFGYGGDFGERHHMRNICMDGLVTPDRVPHSGLLEAKAVFAPLRITQNANGGLNVQNRHNFTDLSAYDLVWSVCEAGKTVAQGSLSLSCAPGESVCVDAPYKGAVGPEAVLYVRALTQKETSWAPKGHEIAAFSFAMDATEVSVHKGRAAVAPTVLETPSAFVVSGEGFSYTFQKDEGVLGQMTLGGSDLLEHPMEWSCFRAPTDNDNSIMPHNNILAQWSNTKLFGNLEYPNLSVRNFVCNREEDHVLLMGDFLFAVPGRRPISRGKILYRIDGDGSLHITQRGRIHEELPYWLPRYGYRLTFAEPLSEMEYFGYGPAECYEDKCTHALLGRYAYVQDESLGAYEKPQESGSHLHTKWLTARSRGQGIRIEGDFSFSASRYDVHQKATARHQKDLVPMAGSELFLDYRMSGVGSASCGGQMPVDACRIHPDEEMDFTLVIKPADR